MKSSRGLMLVIILFSLVLDWLVYMSVYEENL
jgi:hypothetical protein